MKYRHTAMQEKDFTTETHRDVHRAHWETLLNNIKIRKLYCEIRSEITEKNCFLLKSRTLLIKKDFTTESHRGNHGAHREKIFYIAKNFAHWKSWLDYD